MSDDPANLPEPAARGGGSPPVTVMVCTTCRRAGDAEDAPRAGASLAAALVAAANAEGVLRPVQCLANCSRGPSAALARPGAWTYVFGGLDPAGGAPALLEGARLLAAAPDGLMPWRGRPEALKRGMVARVPPPLEAAP